MLIEGEGVVGVGYHQSGRCVCAYRGSSGCRVPPI